MTQKIIRRAKCEPKMRTVRSVARKMKGKEKCAPSGVDAENLEGELHQIVAGGDDEDMKKHQPEECLLLLCVGKCVHKNLSERRSDGISYRRNAV